MSGSDLGFGVSLVYENIKTITKNTVQLSASKRVVLEVNAEKTFTYDHQNDNIVIQT
jgi:hypothetical protein